MTDKDEEIFDDALNALDDITLSDEEKVSTTSSAEAHNEQINQEEATTFQAPFPYAPEINDPNIRIDETSVKYLVDTAQYEPAIDMMINILRSKEKKVDKNVVVELVLKIVQNGKISFIDRLLPYLSLAVASNDPILKMNVNNLMLYIKIDYDKVIKKLKDEIQLVCDAIYEQYNTTYIPLVDLVYNVGTSIEVISTILNEMIKNKEIDGKIDIAKNIFEYEPKGALYRCPHCGKEIDPNAESCPYCWNDIYKCGICFNFIKEEEKVVCPFCNATFHEKHLVEWVKKSGTCPVCQNKLTQTEIATVLCAICGMEIKKGEKDIFECPYCKAAGHLNHWKEYVEVYGECPECHKKIDKNQINLKKK
ncbi:MAG: RING finger domain-containing protein [Candidatus Helarchaeota archaeon]